MSVKLPWQKSDDTAPTEGDALGSAENTVSNSTNTNSEKPSPKRPKGYTPPKGRPTPKRRERELERGIVRPASGSLPTPKQQREERKKLKASMSKEEWKDYKRKERNERRQRQIEAQAAMDRGDERYLMPRDKGPERRFARDWVDARRFTNNFVMPVALGLLVVMLAGQFAPKFASIMSLLAMMFIIIFAVEGVIIGRRVNRAVRANFPGTLAAGFGLGFYAYSRATQPRKWRSPRPQVEIGADIN